MERFDLVVIGSGPAGEKGAAQAAYFGKSVALVERLAEPGGVSVHTGTLPSKTLREIGPVPDRVPAARALRNDASPGPEEEPAPADRAAPGRDGGPDAADQAQLRAPPDHDDRRAARASSTPGTIGVFDADGKETRRLAFDAALVAVGSSPLPPRGLTFDDPDVEDSDRILDLDRIPKSLAVVGGGVIGCEYASLFAALGTRVTLIEGRDRLLGFLDGEVSSTLKIALERMGGEVLLGDAVETISREPNLPANALRLTLKSGRVLAADKVLFSAGRRGNTDGLGLEQAGVAFDEKGRIPVDDHFRTNVPRIYAAGDVVGFPALAVDLDGAGARRRVPRFRHSLQDRPWPGSFRTASTRSPRCP